MDTIDRQLARLFDDLPPQLRKAAQHLTRHPDDGALMSMRQLAAAAGVSPASLLRLVRMLGYGRYEDFRDVLRAQWKARPVGPFAARAQSIVARAGSDAAMLVAATQAAAHVTVDAALAAPQAATLVAVAERLAAARRIAVIGLRSSFPPAFALSYSLALFREGVLPLAGVGGLGVDALDHCDERDVLVAVGVAPLTRETVLAARQASRQGLTVIAITDSTLSPLGRAARHVVLVGDGGVSLLQSQVGTVAVVEALVSLVMARLGPEALAAVAAREQHLQSAGAYWSEADEMSQHSATS